MGVAEDLYETLELKRVADVVDVRKAYRRLALQFHPDRDASSDAQRAFARIATAYDVLSQPHWKAVYDRLGEEGLREGTDDGAGTYSPPNPLRVFEKFFGTANPFTAELDSAPAFVSAGAGPKVEVPDAHAYVLELTLEEAYTGVTKVVPHRKRVHLPSGEKTVLHTQLSVVVPPSTPDGEHFLFNKDNKEPWGPAAVVVKLKPHPVFERAGNSFDIVHTARVPLVKALTGFTLTLTALDGRVLSVPVPDVTTGASSKTLEGYGMRRPDGSAGALHVRFEVLFPKALGEAQKELLRAALFLPETPSAEQAAAVKAFTRVFADPKHGWARGYAKH